MPNDPVKDLHKELVKQINLVYGKKVFSVKRSQKSPSDIEYNAKNLNEINAAVALFSELMFYTGGSATNIDLFKLLQEYLINENARTEINKVITKYYKAPQ